MARLKVKGNNYNRSYFRIYWEDTDAGGIVYYANYLKFCERARTEFLRSRGIEQKKLADKNGVFFVVRKFTGDLKGPAQLDDEIMVETEIEKLGAASIKIIQRIYIINEQIFSGEFLIACVNKELRPIKLPPNIREKLSN